MYFVCLTVCCAAQWSYAGQNYHGIVQYDNRNVSTSITWTQYAQNKWDAIKKDHVEHYRRIGNAHAQAGQFRNLNISSRKK